MQRRRNMDRMKRHNLPKLLNLELTPRFTRPILSSSLLRVLGGRSQIRGQGADKELMLSVSHSQRAGLRTRRRSGYTFDPLTSCVFADFVDSVIDDSVLHRHASTSRSGERTLSGIQPELINSNRPPHYPGCNGPRAGGWPLQQASPRRCTLSVELQEALLHTAHVEEAWTGRLLLPVLLEADVLLSPTLWGVTLPVLLEDADVLLSPTLWGVTLPVLPELNLLCSLLLSDDSPTSDPRRLARLSWALIRSFCLFS
ncbi:hypothetical protein EYF80_000723 [Liparis tanakae]|uniref:Uncharacterized protein n=1 Tax=Liparis tanakae TaxID=230148 RepID=A0A4Z2JF03_9TELE|nr:hypothetical protein EYF80_000723 [Liparis tanakae]